MKRCPKCNRTFETDTQKFCTHDGGLLFSIEPALSETMQFDSRKVQDAVAKPTTRDLESHLPPGFDPEATVVTSAPDESTTQVNSRDTGELAPPQVTQHHIQPPAATPSIPIPPPAPSGPIAPSSPLPSQPAPAPSSSQPLPPVAAKKSKLPLILGILGVLLVLGIGVAIAGYFVVVKSRLEDRRVQPEIIDVRKPDPTPAQATPAEVTKPADEAPAYSPPADAVQFVSSKEGLSEKLSARHVEFSFYYPERWEKDPKSGVGDSANFVEVHRQLPPNFTQESMAVSWYESQGSMDADQGSFHSFVENKSAQFARSIDNYRKVSEGPTKIGIYSGYEFRFEGVSQNTDRGQFKIWGRVVWLPSPDGGKTGATLLMLATSLAPELKSADDVGVKGELPMLLDSFRFARK